MSNDKFLQDRFRSAASNLLAEDLEPPMQQHENTKTKKPVAIIPWDPDAWDGLTEEQAFDECLDDILDKYGREIASVTWNCGSWAAAYECRGRYFAVDEAETTEFKTAKEAIERAGVNQEQFDNIESQWVDEDILHGTGAG